MDEFNRTVMLIGKDGLDKLQKRSVAVFGIGGVGAATCEALARAGIGRITLVDNDKVDITNINRQLIALHSTIGKYKTEIMRERILDINPSAEVIINNNYFSLETIDLFDFNNIDYIVDAIDSVTSKILLIEKAYTLDIPIISAMGAGNKLEPTLFEVTDITKTSVCPLARVMRRELKARGITNLKVVYSKESPKKSCYNNEEGNKLPPASISFVPPVAGMIIAGAVIKDLLKRGKLC